MLSDAPAHHLFVLMAPVKDDQKSSLPEVLAIIQVCLEGNLSNDSVSSSLERGKRAAGDLLPWTISQQFLVSFFCCLFKVGHRISISLLYAEGELFELLFIQTINLWAMDLELFLCWKNTILEK